jgi:hypothetical protein
MKETYGLPNGEIDELLQSLWDWLRSETRIEAVGDGWVEVTTPFLDRHNDCIQVYIKKSSNDTFRLTDDSYTIRDVESSGCDLRTGKRRDMLNLIRRGFGVEVGSHDDDSISALASRENFPQKFLGVTQTMLSVNDLYYLASATVQGIYWEDVANWLGEIQPKYSTEVKLIGRSGFTRKFDFVVPATITAPDRYIQAITHPSKSNIDAFLFAWNDTEEERAPNSEAYALLNDIGHRISNKYITACMKYGVSPVRWSKRQGLIPRLVA